jgi:pyruvate dehydrogenase E2 component (dihydrolipoyllysine-residue acetyltransferase)
MPQLGETVTEGTITKWLKQVGDPIAVDDVLYEVSTDKVDTEVPSAHAGVLRQILVQEGETVAIGTPLAIITDGADDELTEVPAPAAVAGAPPDEPSSTPAPTPVARSAQAVQPRAESRPPVTTFPANGNGFLSPVVRSLLAEHGLDAGEVVGSGRDGRITRADVLAAAANRRAAPAPVLTASSAPATVGYPPATAADDDEIIEFSRARRNTAEHMVRSLATSAHTLVATEVDYHGVDGVRRAAQLSFLPFVGRAVVDAIGEYPRVNASVGDDELIVHPRINLGVAVDVDFEALVVPVVADAGTMRLRALSDAVAALATRARSKRLTTDDLTGGTFTITNVGSYGTLVTAPVINQPQVAILSTDGVKMRPVAVRAANGEWTIAVHPVGNLSLSFDHRAFDGAYAAAFLARVRDILETRDWTQEV